MFGSTNARTLLRVALTVAALTSVVPMFAQELRGRVQGIVTDKSGAIVPGVPVHLKNDRTGVTTTRNTSANGQYIFDFVVAGDYTLEVEAPGFRKFIQRNILVQTRADVTVDPVLEVGAVTETVNVTATPVQVKFNTTSMDLTLDTKMTNDLPIVHRNPFLLATLNPAVVVRSTTEQSPYHHWAANQLDVGGGTSTKNDILVDGVPQLVGAKGSYVPPMDAVSEVNVQQNAVDAEFGHSAGGIISVQMKSGTNEWHGTAYYFGRNPALNAVADPTTHRANMVRNNVWGATSQNPIIRNKLFNFFAYEAQNVREPRTMTLTLPTALERQGDFSQSRTISGALRTIYDPTTTVFNSAQNTSTRQPFADNKIPAARIDRTSARFMKDIWQPNGGGDNITGINNFRETYPQKFEYWNISNRTDWAVSDAVRVFGRVSRFHTVQSDPNFTGSPAQNLAGSARHTWQFSGDTVWTINPSTVFNIRGSYSKITDSFEALNARIERSLLEELWPGNPWYELYLKELPALYYPGLDVRAESQSVFGRDGFWYQEPKTWNLQSKISKQMGAHYAKVGGEFRQQLVLAARPRPMGFRFDKDHTAATFIRPDLRQSGDAWATLLLGVVDQNSRIQNIPLNKPRNNFWGLYAQDDWKLTQNITLNLGLRWEYQTAIYDPEDRLSRFLDLTSPIPEFQSNPPAMPAQVTALRRAPPIYNGAWVFTDGDNRGAWDPSGNFLPRAGIALRLNDRTSLRFGYARYAVASDSATSIIDVLGSTPYQGFDQTTNPLPVLEGKPQARLSDPYPAGVNPLIPPIGKTLGRYTGLGTDTLWFAQDWRNETNDRFNLSLQRQLPWLIVADVTYFANFGHNAPQNINLNLRDPQIAFQHKSLVDQSVPNPFYQILTPNQFPGQLRNQRNVTVASLLAPYPQYGSLTERGVGMSRTRYNAIQLQVQRPFASGFNFLFGYNYNRGRTEEFYDDTDHFDRVVSWQSANFTLPRHKLTSAGIYQLPIGRGRPLLS
ncbi:MAG TPA: TonB-dependent receptor, partial [Bryobacteraceae bacterium]|nr:TonB-dependent receptor [Bryobacteraceae bacterium]